MMISCCVSALFCGPGSAGVRCFPEDLASAAVPACFNTLRRVLLTLQLRKSFICVKRSYGNPRPLRQLNARNTLMTASRPNIIIMNPDEMRADILGHLGAPLSGGQLHASGGKNGQSNAAGGQSFSTGAASRTRASEYCPFSPTPYLDRLVASDAFSFRYAFPTDPVCVPSR